MKAIVCHRYGAPEALRLEEVAKPIPGDHEVLVRIRAAAVNALDWHYLKGTPAIARLFLGLRKPKRNRPGMDLAGQVEAVGRNVTRFKPGDEVLGLCRGSLAEYGCAAESYLAAKPASVSFEQAAAIPLAGLTALQGLRDHGQLQPGQRVLINGASGGVGTFAVQVAKWLGADVTAVCSAVNGAMVTALGADHVVDYAREDYTRRPQRYDVIYDLVMNHPFLESCRVLVPHGRLLPAGGGGADGRGMGRGMRHMLTGLVASRFTSQKLVFCMACVRSEDLVTLAGLLASGTLRSAIDSRHRLSETPEAFRRLAAGHARGKIVVTVE